MNGGGGGGGEVDKKLTCASLRNFDMVVDLYVSHTKDL